MLTVTVNVGTKNGIAGVGVHLPNGLRSPAAAAIIKRRFREVGVDLRAELIKEAPRDTGGIANAHGYVVDDLTSRLVVFNRKQYAVYAHEGRKPGKRPPIEALIPWCRRHIVNARIANQLIGLRAIQRTSAPGFNIRKAATKSEQQQARQMAFLVARAIGRRGTQPNRWFDRVLQGPGIRRIERAGTQIGLDLSRLTVAMVETIAAESQRKFIFG